MCTTGQRYLHRTRDRRAARIIDHRLLRQLRWISAPPGPQAMVCAALKFLPLLLLCAPGLGMAQTGGCTIEGRVTDEREQPLAFVHVAVQGTHLGAVTDARGWFRIGQVPAGEQVLMATAVGQADLRHPVVVGSGTTQVGLRLRAVVTDLPAFTVQSSITGGDDAARRTPGSAWYITPREIQRGAHTDIGRVLRQVPGVNVQEEDGFGLRPNIGLRGAPPGRSAKVTVMEDGVPIAPAPYAAPAAYYFPGTGRMHGIEVVKGGSQVRYGPMTTGGAINLLSTPVPSRTSGMVALWGGSFGTRNVHAHAGTERDGFGMLVETFQQSADGFKQLDNDGPTGFRKADHLVKARWQSPDSLRVRHALSLRASLSTEASDETYLGLTLEDFARSPLRRYAGSAVDRMDVRQDLLSARYSLSIGASTQVMVTAYRTNTYRNWYKLDQVADSAGKVGIAALLRDPEVRPQALGIVSGVDSAPDALLVKANNRNYQSSGVQLTAVHTMQRERARHAMEAGVRLHTDLMDRYQWTDGYRMADGNMLRTSAGRPGTESNRIGSASALATHLSYDLWIGALHVSPGVRHERITLGEDNYGTQDPGRTGSGLATRTNAVEAWSPGIAADLRLHGTLLMFAGTHRGFAPPGATPDVRPERSLAHEAGLRWERPGTQVQAIGFLTTYDQLLGADAASAGGTGSGDLFNAGRGEVAGLELFITHDALHGRSERHLLPLRLAYTLTDARFTSEFASTYDGWGVVRSGQPMPYVARHQVQASLGFEGRKAGGRMEVVHSGAMPTGGAGDPLVPAFTVADVSVFWHIAQGGELFATVRNALDHRYMVSMAPAGARPGLPRTLQLGARFRF